ncbi:sporulation protein [Indiicoccus explosivorum]|uniref:sporulation protein n=1 Tax=Indiicoccus explosivorum TaxID=1917864 RepID=UPI000B455210|nr:sporulation protein [Indiicoccus explosivorum]
MVFRKFLSSIGIGTLTVDTVVETPDISEGGTLIGDIYIEDNEHGQEIEYIELIVLKRKERYSEYSDFEVVDKIVTKQSLEVAAGFVSKNTHILEFQMEPDERWQTEGDEKLILKTVVHILNGVDVSDEDEITYEPEDDY